MRSIQFRQHKTDKLINWISGLAATVSHWMMAWKMTTAHGSMTPFRAFIVAVGGFPSTRFHVCVHRFLGFPMGIMFQLEDAESFGLKPTAL